MTFFYQGDTILDGTSYMNFGLNTFMREDTNLRKVYLYDAGFSDNECLLYDFSLEVGENLENCNFSVPIEEKDTVALLNGELRNRFHYTTNGEEFYVEGIGSRDGFRTLSDPIGPPNYDLMCVKKDGVEIYGARCSEVVSLTEIQLNELLINIFPNPSQSYFSIDSEYEIELIEILDGSGRLVKEFSKSAQTYEVSDLSQGIYLIRLVTNVGVITKELTKE